MNISLIAIFSFEFCAFILSVVTYKKLRNNKLVTFPFFLFFIFSGELFAFFLAVKYHNNVAFHNVFTTIQIVYYLFLIRHNLSSSKAAKILLISIYLFVIVTGVNYFFIEKLEQELLCYTFTLGCVLIAVWVAYYFHELILSDEIENYSSRPFFWIALGLFVFYVCNIPYMSIFNYLANNYPVIFNAYFSIIEFLNYIMYSFFIIGMLCMNKKKLPLQL